jgi:type II pantothenate kinase
LGTDAVAREVWIDIFASHTDALLKHARESFSPPPPDQMASYRSAYLKLLDDVRQNPNAYAPLTIYELCVQRAEMMRLHDIGDPYDRVKAEENEAALALLPSILTVVDGCAENEIVELLVRGILAGNKFDLGAQATIDLHACGGIDFRATLDELPARPWFKDDIDVLADRLSPGKCRYQRAIFFVDNAGGDAILGVVPFTRYLLAQGCDMVLAANKEPALNDILVDELNACLQVAAKSEGHIHQALESRRLVVVDSGCDCPLIDLSDVTAECNAEAADCDLLILEGMGRAIETNVDAVFTCDTIHLAMIKNPLVAGHLGCSMFDLVASFTPAGRSPQIL